ncbi:GNAT family N-acetyltransferase [Natranaerobius trueperi]|uniref:GNAT family N-acetyltransferase n=1 Tax=Natranaerobius trueperi TaxID=759412 RepID=A0A226BV51_9FIRM|nr:GNAT family N-acetyltransferase [Natranaerobius trueperi]OWZ82918.1 GNAT family N-acetyltransferase [Natranaerobius trueperi]
MKLITKKFDQLTLDELYQIIRTRINVFVVEQNCPFEECDNLDQVAIHCFYYKKGTIQAYARIIPPGEEFLEASIGRVLTNHESRGTGLGLQLMEDLIRYMDNIGYKEIRINAQKYLEEFYQKFGFKTVSNTFLIDGIDHLEMLRE